MKRRYSISPDNLLLLNPLRAKTPLSVNGHFGIEDNHLIYYINEPASWRKKYDLPKKIRFVGTWQLNSYYDLELILDETRTQHAGDRLVINGEIISAESDCLAFEVITRKITPRDSGEPELHTFELLKLSGRWQANEYNQLTFLVKKETNPDILTLQGAWQINQNQKITYTCERIDRRTKARVSNVLKFEGFWEIGQAQRLRYILCAGADSYFDFRVQAESSNLYPARGVIKYRLGIGLSSRKRPQEKVISLYGTWKFSRTLGLLFEMDYGEGRVHSLEFGAEVTLSPQNKFIFALRDHHNQPLGLSITFTHKFLKTHDAEAFVRLEGLLRKEGRVEAGIRLPF